MAFQTQGFVQLVFCDPSPRLGGQVRSFLQNNTKMRLITARSVACVASP